jgi:hypothetical protein
MAVDISAKLALTREEIAYIYQGGVMSVRVKANEGDATLEISCVESPPSRQTHIRFKHIRQD